MRNNVLSLFIYTALGLFMALLLFGCVTTPPEGQCPTERMWSICPYTGIPEYIMPGSISPGDDRTLFLDDEGFKKKFDLTDEEFDRILGIEDPFKDAT